MSEPPTDALEISDDSLFSDSIDLDHDKALIKHKINDQSAPKLTQSFHMKSRKTAMTQPSAWEPVRLEFFQDEDPEDEFEFASVRRPIYEYEDDDLAAMRNGEPDLRGEIKNLFDGPELLYWVMNRESKTLAFYNDSACREVHVSMSFGETSKVVPLESTTLQCNAEGKIEARVVVYPGETELFVRGYINGLKSEMVAEPLSAGYFAARSRAQWAGVIQPEIDAIRGIVGKHETDAEVVLEACLAHNLPFVDLSFLPCSARLTGDGAKARGGVTRNFPWARPSMYVRPEQRDQVRLFRDAILPDRLCFGELGNAWVVCALATAAEHPRRILAMFRHPKGAAVARRERALGAYRVTLNKNGLWQNVIVDDYLPVIASTPQVAHSVDPCELWPAILEKAFAKLHGGYDQIEAGDPLHALADLTGAPVLHLEEELNLEADRGVDGELLTKLHHFHKEGYAIVLMTPGDTLPALRGAPGSFVPDFTGVPELEAQLAGTGLLPGLAYTVLSVLSHPAPGAALFKIRNPWPWGFDHNCRWSRRSTLWAEHPKLAREVGFDPTDPTLLWLTWEEVLHYFTAGGVVFTPSRVWDVRVPITFCRYKPTVVLEIQVMTPVKIWMILSNIDNRLIRKESDGDYANSSDYPPIMLSLASSDPANGDTYAIRTNSTSEPVSPSSSKWTFLQARDIAMVCTLEPSELPYLLVPRLLEGEIAESHMRDRNQPGMMVYPEQFANSCQSLCPEDGLEDWLEIAVTLGLRIEGQFESCQIGLRTLPSKNAVFANFPKFSIDGLRRLVAKGVLYQIKSPDQSFATWSWSNDIL